MNDQDEFYIGWQTQASASIGSVMRRITMGILVLLLGLACLLPLAQRTIGTAVFEWGTVKTFRGVLQSQPYPHLLVARPGQAGGQSAYYLVAPLKFGLDTDAMRPIDGKTVTLKGTLIYRGNQTMIEAQADSIHSVSDATGAAKGSKVVSL